MNKQITPVFTCNCRPEFNWKNKNTFRAHKNSNRHQSYEKSFQEKEHRINVNKLVIELNKLKLENKQLRELYLNSAKENLKLKKEFKNE
jgi:hypothetical protein